MERHSDSVYRSCSRCRKELTDAASRECGVGPICRNKNNDIFARQIPANLGTATVLVMAIKSADFHSDVSGEWEALQKSYFKKMERLQRDANDHTRVTLRGADFRKLVDWFDRALSYPCSGLTRNRIIDLVANLGYAALAGVLKGDVCMSPAVLRVEGNYVALYCKSNKDGWRAMRRTFLGGVTCPRWRGDKTPYRALVTDAEKFVEVALRYWPFMHEDVNVENVLAEAKALAEAMPVIVPEPVIPAPVTIPTNVMRFLADPTGRSSSFVPLSIPRPIQPAYSPVPVSERPVARFSVVSDNWTMVSFPWHGTRSQMLTTIGQIKGLPYRDRTYNVASRSWSFRNCHLPRVREIVEARYRLVGPDDSSSNP